MIYLRLDDQPYETYFDLESNTVRARHPMTGRTQPISEEGTVRMSLDPLGGYLTVPAQTVLDTVREAHLGAWRKLLRERTSIPQ